MNGLKKKKWYIHAMEYYSAIKKGTPVIWDNIDELGKYYAE